jgi:hypothetical protein
MIKNTKRYRKENPQAKTNELSLAGLSIVPLFFMKWLNSSREINQLNPNKKGAKLR